MYKIEYSIPENWPPGARFRVYRRTLTSPLVGLRKHYSLHLYEKRKEAESGSNLDQPLNIDSDLHHCLDIKKSKIQPTFVFGTVKE